MSETFEQQNKQNRQGSSSAKNEIDLDDIPALRKALEKHCSDQACVATAFLRNQLFRDLVKRATSLLLLQPNVLSLQSQNVICIGDIHGQFHDLVQALSLAETSFSKQQQQQEEEEANNTIVFTGDYIDRGSWGVEVLTLLLAMLLHQEKQKTLYKIVLLRGNHESQTCAEQYGFKEELRTKYDDGMFFLFRRLFVSLPLACVMRNIEGNEQNGILFVHGGLWRKDEAATQLGTLEDLQNCNRTRLEDVWESDIVSDALWSDPRNIPGSRPNTLRGVGIEFGPDSSIDFLTKHKLSALIRAHEGPDARDKCTAMKSIDCGFTIDHQWPQNGLIAVATVFSAGDYPMFKPPGWNPERHTCGSIAKINLVKNWSSESITFETYAASPHPIGMRFGNRF